MYLSEIAKHFAFFLTKKGQNSMLSKGFHVFLWLFGGKCLLLQHL